MIIYCSDQSRRSYRDFSCQQKILCTVLSDKFPSFYSELTDKTQSSYTLSGWLRMNEVSIMCN
jgi:hypothetical protein